MAKVETAQDGRRWCYHRKCKVVYGSLDEAWFSAFRTFVSSGLLLTPYKCGRSRKYTGIVRVRVTANPYAFNPFREFIGTRKSKATGCGYWHLTSRLTHVLPSADGLWNEAG
jgi:hypothetical protein